MLFKRNKKEEKREVKTTMYTFDHYNVFDTFEDLEEFYKGQPRTKVPTIDDVELITVTRWY